MRDHSGRKNVRVFDEGESCAALRISAGRLIRKHRSRGAESDLAQAYLPPSYVFSHSAASCSTQARASAFLVNPSICVSRPRGGVTRTYQPFPLFDRTGSNLAFGVETGIVKLCDVLHRNTRTKFLSLIKATGAQIRAMPSAKHGSTRMEPMDLIGGHAKISRRPHPTAGSD